MALAENVIIKSVWDKQLGTYGVLEKRDSYVSNYHKGQRQPVERLFTFDCTELNMFSPVLFNAN